MASMVSPVSAGMINSRPEIWNSVILYIQRKGELYGRDLDSLSAIYMTSPMVTSLRSGMLVLDGLILKKTGESAHLTLTPGQTGEWSYFHFTIVGGDGRVYYYELDESEYGEICVKPSSKTLIYESNKLISITKTHYASTTHDSKITKDLSTILNIYLTDNQW